MRLSIVRLRKGSALLQSVSGKQPNSWLQGLPSRSSADKPVLLPRRISMSSLQMKEEEVEEDDDDGDDDVFCSELKLQYNTIRGYISAI